jgi:hypothetical protein
MTILLNLRQAGHVPCAASVLAGTDTAGRARQIRGDSCPPGARFRDGHTSVAPRQ